MAAGFEQTKEDLQRTVREILRVLLYRRWAFLIPFSVAATIVFISSHKLPRVYKASTIFERKNTIPISKVLQETGPESLEAMRRTMYYDMLGPEAKMRIAIHMGLADELDRDPSGKFTEASLGRLRGIAGGLGDVSYRVLEGGKDLDRIEVSATGDDPDHVVDLVKGVRDTYIEFGMNKFLGLLSEAQGFYQKEIDAENYVIEQTEEELEELKSKFPYVEPNSQSYANIELLASKRREAALTKEIDDHRSELAMIKTRLNEMPAPRLRPTNTRQLISEGTTDRLSLEEERRRLRGRVMSIQNEIENLRIDRQMRDAHPDIQKLMRRELAAVEELKRVDQRLAALVGPEYATVEEEVFDDPATVAIQQQTRMELQYELAKRTSQLTEAEKDLKEVKRLISESERIKAESYEQKGRYRDLQKQLQKSQGKVTQAEINEGQIARVLELEDKNQGIEYFTIEEAGTTSRPILPKSQTILMLALGVGLAFGACTVFLREFFDHTFHTANAVSFSLGCQVLEGIDEILLPGDRRKTLLKRLVAIPVAGVFLCAVATSGSLAYLSIENPQKYKDIVNRAMQTWEQVSLFG